MKDILYLVIPCYNEEEVLPETAGQLLDIMEDLISKEKISSLSRIVFVNDGSKDRTWEIITELHEANKLYQGICLSRNRGHQNALLAGLMTVKPYCDIAISIDADLQDDVAAVEAMVDKYHEGNEIVYGVRNSRETDNFFKRFTAEGYYRLMNTLGADIVFNHADYRLMSRKALDGMEEFSEVNIFLRGIVPMIGYKSAQVYYTRKKRFAGKSKYPLKKMLAFAWEGITSLSTKPIKMITVLGICSFIVSIIFMVYSVVRYFMGETITGWASIMVSLWMIGGLILLSLGIIGEYLGKVYLETKGRPRFIVERYLRDEENAETEK